MTDTQDTNLTPKPVELEEELKTAEVAEPVATETPAEENTTGKPVETAQRLTKDEVLAKLKEIAANVETAPKADIDSLKQAFYKLHNAELEAARKQFIENGGSAEDFIPTPDPAEEEFKNVMSVIKENRRSSGK